MADHVPPTDAELAELEALDRAGTSGPWGWFGNASCHEVHLATRDRGRVFVMRFARWGMSGAQPVFQIRVSDGGVMEPAAKGMLQFEVPYRKDIVGIDHPDARLIPAARNALPHLLAEVRRLRAAAGVAEEFEAKRARLRAELRAMDDEAWRRAREENQRRDGPMYPVPVEGRCARCCGEMETRYCDGAAYLRCRVCGTVHEDGSRAATPQETNHG